MLNTKEREIVERCLAISIWNYRSGKSLVKGNKIEAEVFQEKIQKEFLVLRKLVKDSSPPSVSVDISVDREKEINLTKIGKFQSFLNKLIGRKEDRVSIS